MRNEYKITLKNAEEIKEYRKQVKDKMTDRRMYAVQLVGEGEKYKAVAEKLDGLRTHQQTKILLV